MTMSNGGWRKKSPIARKCILFGYPVKKKENSIKGNETLEQRHPKPAVILTSWKFSTAV